MAAIPGSVRLTGFVAPTDSTDTYAVTDPTYGRGSLRSVANIAARNAITKDRRVGQLGMEVVTIDTMSKYRLINEPGTTGTTDTDWELMETSDLWDSDGTDLTPHSSENVVLPTDKKYSFAQPAGSTFYATFSAYIDGDYGLGSMTGTAVGGAAIVAGKLDLAHTDNRYVSFSATSNADSQQVGTFKFKIIPNYSGSPAAIRPIFSVASALSANLNEIALWHAADGTIRLNISDSSGSPIISNASFGAWGQTALTEYEFELDFDITTGATRLFINGTQTGSTNTSTGTRSSSIGVLLVGQLAPNPTFLPNIYVKDFIVFNAVQHTSNYSSGYTLQNVKLSKTNSIVNNLQVFGDTVLSNLLVDKGILQTNSNGKISSSTALPDGTTATTQSAGDNTTKPATDAFVQTSLEYTNAAPTPSTLGGIPSGSTFSAEANSDMWTALLYPYQYPAFTSFSISGQATTVEVGVSISGAKTFIWATSNSGNVATNSINIYDVTGSTTLFTSLANDGSEAYVFPSPIQLVTQDSYVWQIEGTNTHVPPTTFNRNFTVNWYWRVHSGMDVNTTLTNAQILALANSSLTTAFPPQVSFAGGGYFWYWIPSTFVQPTIFKDHATGFAIGMEAAVTQSVTNAYSIATNYKGYRSTNTLVSALTIDVS